MSSNNPVKLEAARQAFQKVFPELDWQCEGIPFTSGVSDQPSSDQETLQGALNRAENARKAIDGADYWVGMEGGIVDNGNLMEAFAWIVVMSRDLIGQSRTATFVLPPEVATLIRGGMELAHADDKVFGRQNSGYENGAVGILTGDLITRAVYYEQAAILALIPFRNRGLYSIQIQ